MADVDGGGVGSNSAERDAFGAPAPIDIDGFTVTDGMRRWAKRDGYSDIVDIDFITAQFVSHYRSTGAHRRSWPDAWQKWVRDEAQKAKDRASRFGGNVVPFAQPGAQRPSTTDARVQAAIDLGRQMQAEFDAAQAAAHKEAQ